MPFYYISDNYTDSEIDRKNEYIFVFYCFENPSSLITLESQHSTGPIQARFSAKYTCSNEHFSQIQNCKCHMFDFRLISLDRIVNSNCSNGILQMQVITGSSPLNDYL